MAKTMQCYLQSTWVVLVPSLRAEDHRKEMAQAAKLLAGVLCSSALKQITQLISNPGRFPVPKIENIMAMQGVEHRRWARGLGVQGSNPAKTGVTSDFSRGLAGGYCCCVCSAAGLTVIPLTGHLRIRSLPPDMVIDALLCLGWAEGSLAKGYIMAEHKEGFSEMLRKEGRKSPLLFVSKSPSNQTD